MPSPTAGEVLLINPFYSKDPWGSFGKHVLTPSLALTSIAAAAGLRTDVFPDEAVLVRHLDNGTDVRVCLDISRITDGADPNIQLTAGDILWVPHTAETRVQEWINRNIYFRAGASAGLSYNFLHNKDILNGTDGNTTVLIGN